MRQAAFAIMQAIPHPLAAKCCEALASHDLSRLPVIRPDDFKTPSAYLEAAQVIACVKKLRGLIPGMDEILREKAETTFIQCEEQCRATNRRLARLINMVERPYIEDEHDLLMFNYISDARRIAARILGPLPLTLGQPLFSDGSSFLNRATRKTLPHKLGGACAVTPQLLPIVHLLEAQNAPRWTHLRAEYGTQVVKGNRFTTVPKDSEKDRGICVEPLQNLSWQLAVGNLIRHRLKREVVEIDGAGPFQGQQLHQFLAQWGSSSGELATGDQSNASDTVSRDLVRLLLPKGWYDLLNTLRCHHTFFRGEWVKLEKFSSMGNGFTFELETLIFYVLLRALRPSAVISVYGDDLIFESEMAEDVGACLTFFGFTQNLKKSYSSGPFRESCGGDYFNGHPVRPIFLRGSPATPTEWFTFVNNLQRISANHNWGLEPLIADIIEQTIPKWARLYGPPEGTPSNRWIETDDRNSWRTKAPDGYLLVRGLQARYGKRYKSWLKRSEALWCALIGTPSDGPVIDTTSPVGFKQTWYAP